MYYQPPPTTYATLKTYALQVDQTFAELQNNINLAKGRFTSSTSKTSLSSSTGFCNPNAMEIDTAGFSASDFNSCNSDKAKRKCH